MRIDWWTLALQTVNVFVLVWILARFLFRPVAAIIAARQAEAVKLLEESRAARAGAASDREKAADEIGQAAAVRREALKTAALEAEAEKSTLLAAARTEADGLRDAARADIDRERKDEAVRMDDRANELAVDIAAKLFARLPDEARVAGFIDELANAVAALPSATKMGIGAEQMPVHLKAARMLTEGETQTCRERLAAALGHALEIEIQSDPGLIAGLEMDTPHVLVCNSFRADLDRIATDLVRHDRVDAAQPEGASSARGTFARQFHDDIGAR